ncbi:hypothetical protein CCR91_21215 [Thiorhodovibrio winogradskyi]|nr:hypothetical protein [Thiorhodovibrio winogradskyi]
MLPLLSHPHACPQLRNCLAAAAQPASRKPKKRILMSLPVNATLSPLETVWRQLAKSLQSIRGRQQTGLSSDRDREM